ncbi:hypothetical protein F751_4288 [Auxenochlorella protothecoides]|uniref:Uncharacterized protein n=1 Tax=Auxenochlorella protothecoides TaxID=3075 RepID=A0A087SA90_AUXPR|nr:hypothetical protein F751_4288 [Auxenochlorella protothecoides]KFM22644.1 hypothetical protein F751_4288 [Auxenochlorella protothecoides]
MEDRKEGGSPGRTCSGPAISPLALSFSPIDSAAAGRASSTHPSLCTNSGRQGRASTDWPPALASSRSGAPSP